MRKSAITIAKGAINIQITLLLINETAVFDTAYRRRIINTGRILELAVRLP